MTIHRVLGTGLLALTTTFAPSTYALDEAGAQQVIGKYLASQKLDDASAQADKHVIADLNGDGRPDIVLVWNVMGPTWSRPKLSIFLDQGKNYRTLTTDLGGQIEHVSVKGSDIVLDTLQLGPKDPRCCPTQRKLVRYRWAGGKLTLLN
jgi:hypothetical protein